MSDTIKYLAGNPIRLSFVSGTSIHRFKIYTGLTYDLLIFDGTASSLTETATIDVTELFESMKSTSGIVYAKLIPVDSSGVELSADQILFTVYGGGISKLLRRKLEKLNTDIFSWKLKNSATNFLLTSRTNNYIISIPENELIPLAYYARGHKFAIKADGDTIAAHDHTLNTVDTIQYLDFAALRESYVAQSNKLVSVFDIVTDDSYSFSVIITEAPERSDFFLKFRNSWGEWEKIALYGFLDYSPVFEEKTKTAKWDDTIEDFVESNNRSTLSNAYKANTGYRNESDRFFLLDMLMSDSVVLIVNGDEYDVRVSSEEITGLISTDGQPVNVTLAIELIDTDTYISDLVSESGYSVLTKTTLENITSGNADILV